jgi:hypothetical protein
MHMKFSLEKVINEAESGHLRNASYPHAATPSKHRPLEEPANDRKRTMTMDDVR